METIVRIREIEGKLFGGEHDDYYDGWEIETTEQKIYVTISNNQMCCENWGYIVSDDDLDSFIGAELISVSIVDGDYEKLRDVLVDSSSEIMAVFVCVETNLGELQFAVYNDHNGYYGHGVIVKSRSIDEYTSI